MTAGITSKSKHTYCMILTGRLLFLMYSWILFSRIDSIMLVEEGFNLVSVDASDKMLKYALKARWDRRKEPAFDQWGMKIKIYLLNQ